MKFFHYDDELMKCSRLGGELMKISRVCGELMITSHLGEINEMFSFKW